MKIIGKDRIEITHEEWMILGTLLYGKNKKEWKFKCVRCGNVQSYQDFIDAGLDEDTAHNMFYFSCLGRVKKGVGCDWTLGGLFQIHKIQVTLPDPDEKDKLHTIPVFEFADAPVTGEEIAMIDVFNKYKEMTDPGTPIEQEILKHYQEVLKKAGKV